MHFENLIASHIQVPLGLSCFTIGDLGADGFFGGIFFLEWGMPDILVGPGIGIFCDLVGCIGRFFIRRRLLGAFLHMY